MSPRARFYEKVPFPTERRHVLDALRTWAIEHPVHGLLEVDVTLARQLVRKYRTISKEKLSFTDFIIYCVGRAVDENRAVHALRNWKNELVLFDEVDLNTVVEVASGKERFPVAHIIRSANKKSLKEIHEEIRSVQTIQERVRVAHKFKSMPPVRMIPFFARRMFYRIVRKNPVWMKKHVGTVALTAVGMFARGTGWGLPVSVTPLFITLGGIGEKPKIVHGQTEVREYLSITVTFDHDIIDGAPAARFTARLKQMIESGEGLIL